MKEKINSAFAPAAIEKVPLASVMVPAVVPLMVTFTPGMAVPEALSLTVPVTVRSWALAQWVIFNFS